MLEGAEEAQQKLRSGKFPEDIQNQFREMLDYFGQSPIIVRSSSLLEDAYGNSFSGKYESVFCANQGTPQERLENFMNAVRMVYASTISKEALTYRAYRGLLDRDEQMALLIQRVSGAMNGDLYFPQIAGVGFSFNPYVWNVDIDPKAGMLRLVFGLGTRAVGRSDDDYTRVVALNVPNKRPEATLDAVRKYAQRRVDILDLRANQLVTRYFEDVVKSAPELPLELFATRDEELEKRAEERNMAKVFSWVLTFDRLFSDTEFVQDIQELLQVLHRAYDYAVDVEFTLNFLEDGSYRINLLQCRPFQVKGTTQLPLLATGRGEPENIILETQGPIIGNSVATVVDRLIYVVPSIYGKMKMSDRYAIARLIGQLTHLDEKKNQKKIMLLGPGRWGTSTPSLGIPVTFAEINTVSVLCEIAIMHVGLVPDISLGTHFFNDLVEQDMLYVALYPEKKGYGLNETCLKNLPNQLTRLLPDAATWAEAVWVIDTTPSSNQVICLNMNAIKQTGICYIDTKK
ncbi:MAG: PEP/pyruvate-binding domain-containing protein [bacterium]|nr:PEP/pyruvate-binding domain-containing protein [bacterium]